MAELELRLELTGAGLILEIGSVEGLAGKDDEVVMMVDGSDDVLVGMLEKRADAVLLGVMKEERADGVIDFAVPNLDPMENRLMALTPEQQLPLCRSVSTAEISQHNSPPWAAQRSEHCHIMGTRWLKSYALSPLYSSAREDTKDTMARQQLDLPRKIDFFLED